MRKKIVHLSSVHDAFDNRIWHKECASLANAGYDVTLIAPHAGGDLRRGGVMLRALPVPTCRLMRFTVTIGQVLRAAVEENASVYHYHDPELMPVGLALKLLGKKVVYDVHEDYGGSVTRKPWIPVPIRGAASLAVRVCEAIFARTCDRIVAATPVIAAKFHSGNVVLVQNYPWLEEMKSDHGPEYGRRGPVAVYIGALSEDRGVFEMVAAARSVASALPFRLRVAGKSAPSVAAFLNNAADAMDYVGVVNRSEVAAMLSGARIGLCTLHATANYVASQPTKLDEYMAAGIPVIASDFPVWRAIVQSSGCGILVDPLDVSAIEAAIRWLLQHPEEAEAMGRAGQRAITGQYNWQREARALVAMYGELTLDDGVRPARRVLTKETRG